MRASFFVVGPLVMVLLAGCAQAPSRDPLLTSSIGSQLAVAASNPEPLPPVVQEHHYLAGRTLEIASAADLHLRPGEVVLSFDDGPSPSLTPTIVRTLDRFGVHGVFMMVGKMAEAHPATVQMVAQHGHTIGTHSYDHANLTEIDQAAALSDVQHGQTAVAQVLTPIGLKPSPLFRFPYLAQTALLRTGVVAENSIILDVGVDSQDYLNSTPDEVLQRTLSRLTARGRGVILFHDIHPRTAQMLPDLLQALEDKGFTVVSLDVKQPESWPVLTASVD